MKWSLYVGNYELFVSKSMLKSRSFLDRISDTLMNTEFHLSEIQSLVKYRRTVIPWMNRFSTQTISRSQYTRRILGTKTDTFVKACIRDVELVRPSKGVVSTNQRPRKMRKLKNLAYKLTEHGEAEPGAWPRWSVPVWGRHGVASNGCTRRLNPLVDSFLSSYSHKHIHNRIRSWTLERESFFDNFFRDSFEARVRSQETHEDVRSSTTDLSFYLLID